MAEGCDTLSDEVVSGSKTTRKDLQKMVFKSVKRIKLMVQMNLEVGDFTTWLGAGGGFYICENGILVQNPNLGASNG